MGNMDKSPGRAPNAEVAATWPKRDELEDLVGLGEQRLRHV